MSTVVVLINATYVSLFSCVLNPLLTNRRFEKEIHFREETKYLQNTEGVLMCSSSSCDLLQLQTYWVSSNAKFRFLYIAVIQLSYVYSL